MGGSKAHTAGGIRQPSSKVGILKSRSNERRLNCPFPINQFPGQNPAGIHNIPGRILPQYRRENLKLTPRIEVPFRCFPNFLRTAIHVIGIQFLTQGAFTLRSDSGCEGRLQARNRFRAVHSSHVLCTMGLDNSLVVDKR